MEGVHRRRSGIFQKGLSQGIWDTEVPQWHPGAKPW